MVIWFGRRWQHAARWHPPFDFYCFRFRANRIGGLEGQGQMAAQDSATVELCITSWCVYCKRAKLFLRSRGISFVEYDIERDPTAAGRLSRLTSSRGVSFAMVDGRLVAGFSEAVESRARIR